MDSKWNLVVSSLQNVYNANEMIMVDVAWDTDSITNLPQDKVPAHLTKVQQHLENVNRVARLLDDLKSNLKAVIEQEEDESDVETPELQSQLVGKAYWVSSYIPEEPIHVGDNVAYRPKKSTDGEWYQCEVVKISADGLRYEVRDPEPDEYGNTGKMFKCSWKDILSIPAEDATRLQMPNYPSGTKVLARYPETTTFYPAIVISHKRDGTCRLRFDGEEEVDKETEVPRRYVLPFPTISAKPTKK